jgi:hypothetical protein
LFLELRSLPLEGLDIAGLLDGRIPEKGNLFCEVGSAVSAESKQEEARHHVG